MKITITTLLLLISVCNISFGQGTGTRNEENNETNSGQEIDACPDPRFKAAELAAYQALLQARAEAARVLAEEISVIEKAYNKKKGDLNDDYQRDLAACGNKTSCNETAKADYNKWISRAQADHDGNLVSAQNKEKASNEEAQKNYNAAVEEARKLYPPFCYKASGQNGPVVYTGTVCSLEKPFMITGTISAGPIVYPFEFIPSNGTAGTFSFKTKFKLAMLEGSGTYTIEGSDTGKPWIVLKTNSSGTLMGKQSSGSGAARIDLVCNGSK